MFVCFFVYFGACTDRSTQPGTLQKIKWNVSVHSSPYLLWQIRVMKLCLVNNNLGWLIYIYVAYWVLLHYTKLRTCAIVCYNLNVRQIQNKNMLLTVQWEAFLFIQTWKFQLHFSWNKKNNSINSALSLCRSFSNKTSFYKIARTKK